MNGIDQDKLEGLRELIKLLLALTQAERPRVVYPMPPFAPPTPAPPAPPEPAQPGASEGGMNLVHAAHIVERCGAHAQEVISKGTEESRKALLQLAKQRDDEQNAVDEVIKSLTSLKALQHHQRHGGEPSEQLGEPAAKHPHRPATQQPSGYQRPTGPRPRRKR